MNRRFFLKTTAFAIIGGVIAPGLLKSCVESPTNNNIGLQLYSLRDIIRDDGIESVLKMVSKMGFKNLEITGYENGKIYDKSPEELKKIVNKYDMSITSSHVEKLYDKDDETNIMQWWDETIDVHKRLGVKYLVQTRIPANNSILLDDIKVYCDYFSKIGELVSKSDMSFAYHNHAFEFNKIGDELIYDYILDNVNKNYVNFQLDVYYAQQGGYNPVDLMKKYSSQIKSLHIRDEKELGTSGEVNFEAIFEQAKLNNITDWYIEVDKYSNNDPIESVSQSIEYLKKGDFTL